MEDTDEPQGSEQTKLDMASIRIRNEPIMQSAIDVTSILGNKRAVALKASGKSIPNAVAVANIVTDKILKDKTKIQKITLDTEEAAGIGRMTSTVEIIIKMS